MKKGNKIKTKQAEREREKKKSRILTALFQILIIRYTRSINCFASKKGKTGKINRETDRRGKSNINLFLHFKSYKNTKKA